MKIINLYWVAFLSIILMYYLNLVTVECKYRVISIYTVLDYTILLWGIATSLKSDVYTGSNKPSIM